MTDLSSSEAAKPRVYLALVSAIGDCAEGIKKKHDAGQGTFRYKFRGVDDAMQFLNPILSKHLLAIVPHKVVSFSQDERRSTKVWDGKTTETVVYCSKLHMAYRLYHADGSFIEGETVCENANGQDKGPNACMSVGWKYFAIQTFCIPVDDASVDDESKDGHNYLPRDRLQDKQPQQRREPPPANAPAETRKPKDEHYLYAFPKNKHFDKEKGIRHDIRKPDEVDDPSLVGYIARLEKSKGTEFEAYYGPFLVAAKSVLNARVALQELRTLQERLPGEDDIPF